MTKPFKLNPFKQKAGKIKDYLEEHRYYDDKPSGSEIFLSDFKRSTLWGTILAVLFCLILVARLFLLQVQEGFINFRLSQRNRLRNIPISAPRGLILDDKGEPLVENETVYQLIFQPSKKGKIDSLDEKVLSFIGISRDELKNKADSERPVSDQMILKDKIPRDDALLLKSRLAAYDEFEVIQSYSRKYQDQSLSHLLGYLGKPTSDEVQDKPSLLINGFSGKSGVEKNYDLYLQGNPGYRQAEVDASGRIMRILAIVEPQGGRDVKSSIDRGLQSEATKQLKAKTDELHTNGALVAMDPRDGSIKALISFPDYDSTAISSGLSSEAYNKLISDSNKPLFNRAIAGAYPPGSSIKPYIATAALADGVVNPDVFFDTPSEIVIGQWHFPDWKDHGTTDIRRAIAESNNIFFFALGGGWGPIENGLGPDGLKNGLDKFNFGRLTQVDLPGETSGFIPTPAWKKRTTGESWFIGNTYNMSIGQGDLLVTPLQLAAATSAIANGGKYYKPHAVTQISASNRSPEINFDGSKMLVNNQLFNSDAVNVAREGMRQTVTSGSAKSVFGSDFPLEVAGKTGTAQFGSEDKTHAWFTSFAPYNDPKIAIVVLVEGGGEGNVVATPIAKEIYKWYAENRN